VKANRWLIWVEVSGFRVREASENDEAMFTLKRESPCLSTCNYWALGCLTSRKESSRGSENFRPELLQVVISDKPRRHAIPKFGVQAYEPRLDHLRVFHFRRQAYYSESESKALSDFVINIASCDPTIDCLYIARSAMLAVSLRPMSVMSYLAISPRGRGSMQMMVSDSIT